MTKIKLNDFLNTGKCSCCDDKLYYIDLSSVAHAINACMECALKAVYHAGFIRDADSSDDDDVIFGTYRNREVQIIVKYPDEDEDEDSQSDVETLH